MHLLFPFKNCIFNQLPSFVMEIPHKLYFMICYFKESILTTCIGFINFILNVHTHHLEWHANMVDIPNDGGWGLSPLSLPSSLLFSLLPSSSTVSSSLEKVGKSGNGSCWTPSLRPQCINFAHVCICTWIYAEISVKCGVDLVPVLFRGIWITLAKYMDQV